MCVCVCVCARARARVFRHRVCGPTPACKNVFYANTVSDILACEIVNWIVIDFSFCQWKWKVNY